MDWREEALNDLLTAAWKKYAEALSSGETVELEGDYEAWVTRALEQHVTIRPADAVA